MKDKLAGRKKSESGISTLEILIAMVILITALSTVILVVFGNQDVTVSSQNESIALYRASQIIERARAEGAADFNNLISSSSLDDIFTEGLLVTDVNPCQKNVTGSVSWSAGSSPAQAVEINTIISNPAEAFALGGDCGPENPPSTGWDSIICENPNAPSWDFSPSGIPATGIEIKKSGSNTYAIITGDGSSSGQNDFWVVNATSRDLLGVSPVSIDTGNGLNDVDIAGDYAFVTSNETTKQLRVIDISTLTSPIEILSASRSLTAVGTGSEGNKIFYYNNKVYVGSKARMISYNEFQIFDVATPTSPITNSAWTYDVDHIIYDIEVRDQVVSGVVKTLAYLAVSDSVGDKPKLLVLDVTNPASITQFGSYNPTPNSTLYATSLDVLGGRVYLGRQGATSASGNHDLLLLNISNPAAVSLLDSARLDISASSEVRGLIASGPILFSITTDNNKGFQAWDISDPLNISLLDTCKYPQEALDMEFDGNFIYIVNKSQDALRIIYDNANPFP